MIEAQNLTKHYGDVTALAGVTFTVRPGEVLGYLGPNGAGKSTTVKMLTGMTPPTSGNARICGYDLAAQPLEAKRRLGLVPESGAVYEALTPLEYLEFVAALYGIDATTAQRRARDGLATFGLEERAWARRMSGFSKGMKQRVAIVAATMHTPEVLLFDEPLNGLDVQATMRVKRHIAEQAARGCAILYCSHLLDVVERVCNRVLVLVAGRVRFEGTLQEMRALDPGGTLESAFQQLTELPAAGPAARAEEIL